MHTYTPANSIFDNPITTLLLILCILIETLSRVHAKGAKKALMISNVPLLIGRFPSEVAADMTVKGFSLDCVYPEVRDVLKGSASYLTVLTARLMYEVTVGPGMSYTQ